MENQTPIAPIPDPATAPSVFGNTPSLISVTTNRFPVWMSRHPIQWLVSVAALIALLTLLCLGWIAYTVQHGLIQSSGERLVQAATHAAQQLDSSIQERYRDIQFLSTTPMVQGQSPEALTTYIRKLARSHPAYRWIGVTDAQGNIIASTDPSLDSQDQSRHLWFQQSRTLTDAIILDAQTGETSGEALAITIVAPLHSPDRKFLGAISAVLDIPSLMTPLNTTVDALKSSEWTGKSHVEYHVVNKNGDLVAGSPVYEDGNLKQLGLPSATLVERQERGFIEETDLHRGISVITAYAQVAVANSAPPQSWGILIHIDRENVLTPIRSFLKELSVLAILILLPLLGLVLGMTKTLHEELSATKREFQRASDAETVLRKRTETLHSLIVATQCLAAEQHIDGLLRQLLHLAKQNTGARYAALVIYEGNTHASIQFLTAGTDEAAAHAIRLIPFSQITQEFLRQGNGVIRLAHLRAHWDASELPQEHAPLTSFLGVQIRCHDQSFGHLSLANKAMPHGDKGEFSAMDEQLLITLVAQAGTAIQNLQLLHDSTQQARHDSLTGLLNHSTTLTALTQELLRAERSRQPLAILIADLDHFKQVNDTYGHLIGDLVLRETAKRLREASRLYDLVGRIGGEEFLIVVPNCDLDALRECAERFRSSISNQPFETQNGPLAVTVSIGATVWSSEHPVSQDLLRKMADYALYRVKHKGRNGVDIVPHPQVVEMNEMRKTA